MTPYTEIWFERRSEQMLAAFGLTEVVREPIYRERVFDEREPYQFFPAEREGLMALAQKWREHGSP